MQFSSNYKAIMGVLVLSVMGACGSSKQASDKSPKDDEANKKYALDYTDVMEFTRGVKSSYKISGAFRGEKASRITIDSLPRDAEFVDETLTWQPSCDLRPENGQFLRGYMILRLRINFESNSSDDLIQKPALLIIHRNGEGSICKD